jgi:malate dehydrogenase (oxaloacetate-decarboxylating)(NADP+)
MLKAAGAGRVVLCDSKGVVREDRTDLTAMKRKHAARTAARTVGEAMRGAHVFIGVSVADCVRPEEVLAMAEFPAVFAMANPDPEIRPEAVRAAMGRRPYVMATGRSDYPNQVNNVLGFPFLFRGALDAGAGEINLAMKQAAAGALAAVAREPVPPQVQDLYPDTPLAFGPQYLIPKPFDRRLFVEVSLAVALAATSSGAGKPFDPGAYRASLEARRA